MAWPSRAGRVNNVAREAKVPDVDGHMHLAMILQPNRLSQGTAVICCMSCLLGTCIPSDIHKDPESTQLGVVLAGASTP